MAKGKPFERVVTVAAHSKAGTGIMVGPKLWMNFSKKSGLSASDAPVGQSFLIKGEETEGTGAFAGKPGYFIDSLEPHGAAPTAKAPGVAATSPVQAKTEHSAPGASSYADKADKREASIVTQALMKSFIESPALPIFLGGAKPLAQVVEEEVRGLLAVHDKLAAERGK